MTPQEVVHLLNVTMGLGEIVDSERWILSNIDGEKLCRLNSDDLYDLGIDNKKHRKIILNYVSGIITT